MSQRDPTVLLTLGRLPPAIDIARAFSRNGWRVIVADPFFLNMARTSLAVHRVHKVTAPAVSTNRFKADLARLVDRYSVDLVVPISEETPWVAGLVNEIDTQVFCGATEAVLQLHSKLQFNRLAATLELRVPRTRRSTAADAVEVCESPFVLKPEFSCSGRGVSRHPAGAPLATPDPGLIVQQLIDGEEFSAFAVVHEGHCAVQVTYRAHTRHGSVAVCFERVQNPTIDAWVAAFAKGIEYTGLLSFDFIVDETGEAWAIECNPRATSGVHFVDPDALHAAITTPNTLPEKPHRNVALMQEFWSHWTHWFASIGDPVERRHTGRALRAARDVTWSARDPLVFPLATLSTWPIVWRSIRHRRTFAEVLALDIEWRAP